MSYAFAGFAKLRPQPRRGGRIHPLNTEIMIAINDGHHRYDQRNRALSYEIWFSEWVEIVR